MLTRIISDIHNEFGEFILPSMPNDKETVLVIAGDLDAGNRVDFLSDYLIRLSNDFKAIVYVPGNHEYYHGVIDITRKQIVSNCMDIKNIHVLDNSYIKIENVAFIGSTLWSSFDQGNPLSMEIARRNMRDYGCIRIEDDNTLFGSRTVRPEDIYSLHLSSKKYVFNTIKSLKKECEKIVVISHHSPSFQSIDKMFTGDSLNGAFSSSLENDILDTEPNIWIHGHHHNSSDYLIGDTRVICNPRGYNGFMLNSNFDPLFLVNV